MERKVHKVSLDHLVYRELPADLANKGTEVTWAQLVCPQKMANLEKMDQLEKLDYLVMLETLVKLE